MALDPMEKDKLRQKMAHKMEFILESSDKVACVSGHFHFEPHDCELCDEKHATELLVIKSRSGRKHHVATSCLREMVRFRVVADVDDLPKWLLRMPELKAEAEKRREDEMKVREEERKRLERKVIVRKRSPTAGAT